MGKIDTSEWKEFRIGDYFKVEYGKFHAKDELGTGTVNYITTSGFNNGITNTCEDATHQGNCITVASDGAMGASFYQEEAFTTSNIVSTLTPLSHTPLNKYNALFLCAIIFAKRTEFGWLGFKMSVDRVRNLNVKLPSTPNGDPDWVYMEFYMANLEIKVAESLTLLQTAKDAEKKKVDTREWGEFRVGELFAQERGKEKAPKQNEPGDCPLIQETNNNNGFDHMVVPTKIIKGNSITVSINYAQNVFYQADDFCASVNIAVLRNSHLNRYNSQFVCSVLRNAHQKFDYTSKISKELLNKEMIMLPVDKTGQPDWAYMEEYMRKMERKTNDALNFLDRISTRRKIDGV